MSSGGAPRIDRIRFRYYTDDEIVRLAAVECRDVGSRLDAHGGLNDPRMGDLRRGRLCPTCRSPRCSGHMGFIRLVRPVWRPPLAPQAKAVHRCVCEACARPRWLPTAEDRARRDAAVDGLIAPDARLAALSRMTRAMETCPWSADAIASLPAAARDPDCSDAELAALLARGPCGAPLTDYDDTFKILVTRVGGPPLTPLDSQAVFDELEPWTLRALGFDPAGTTPRQFVTAVVPVVSPLLRPKAVGRGGGDQHQRRDDGRDEATGSSGTGGGGGEDDLTLLYREILTANATLERQLEETPPPADHAARVEAAWTLLVARVADLFNPANSQKLKIPNAGLVVRPFQARARAKRQLAGIYQRFGGKRGRFRNHLMGKRVDYCGRGVVDPAPPDFEPYELGVPFAVASRLYVPEIVRDANRAALRACVVRGPNVPNGALLVRGGGGDDLTYLSVLEPAARARLPLPTGAEVVRALRDGDWVMFNRQPTLHHGSWQAFRARLVPNCSFLLHMTANQPFNADCDGDEMNLHVPQSFEETAECATLLAMPYHVRGAGTNTPRCGLIQTAIAAMFALTREGNLLRRAEVMDLAQHVHWDPERCSEPEDRPRTWPPPIPPPALWIHGAPRWTGAQLVAWILPRDLSLERETRHGPVRIVRGQLVEGRLCSATLGARAHGLVDRVGIERGPWAAARFLGDAHRLATAYAARRGTVSVSLGDCVLEPALRADVRALVDDALARASRVTELEQVAEEAKETAVRAVVSRVRNDVESLVMSRLDERNGMWSLVMSGAKGKPANVAQMAGLVGQQMFAGQRRRHVRVPSSGGVAGAPPPPRYGDFSAYEPRTLSTYAPRATDPRARAFVASSFADGLPVGAMLFHVAAAREGLTDTSIRTAEVGYNTRRTGACIGSNAAERDGTVRTASREIVEFAYGDDNLDTRALELVRVPRGLLDASSSPPPREPHAALTSLVDAARAVWALGARARKETLAPLDPWRALEQQAAPHVARGSSVTVEDYMRALAAFHERVLASQRDAGQCAAILARAGPPSRPTQFLHAIAACMREPLEDPTLGMRVLVTLALPYAELRARGLDMVGTRQLLERLGRAFARARAAAGEAVGVSAAYCSMEPLLQMTLNTFHMAGAVSARGSGLGQMTQLLGGKQHTETARVELRLRSPLDRSPRFAAAVARALPALSLGPFLVATNVVDAPLDPLENLTARAGPPALGIPDDCYPLRVLPTALAGLKLLLRQLERSEILPQDLADSLSGVAVDCVLRRARLVAEDLDVFDVARALERFFVDDAVVTVVDYADTWVVRVRLRGTPALAAVADGPRATFVADPEARLARERAIAERIAVHGLPRVVLRGLPAVRAAAPTSHGDGRVGLEVLGSLLRPLLGLGFVDPSRSVGTCAVDALELLGVEAAQTVLEREMIRIYEDSRVDPRHLRHLARAMTVDGAIAPLTRHSMQRLGAGTLARAAFEMTAAVLSHAAVYSEEDPATCVPSAIITGQRLRRIGTGAVDLVMPEDVAWETASRAAAPMRPLTRTPRAAAPAAVAPLARAAAATAAATARRRIAGPRRPAASPPPAWGPQVAPPAPATRAVAPLRAYGGGAEASPARSVLRQIVQRLRAALPRALELELRLAQGSAAGIPRDFFERTVASLDATAGFDRVDAAWQLSADYFYEADADDGGAVRTTVRYDPSLMQRGELPRAHIIKRQVTRAELRVAGSDAVRGVRASLAAEMDYPADRLPEACDPSFVRVKLRRTWVRGPMELAATVVWEGPDAMEADAVMERAPTAFELEIELLTPQRVLQRYDDDAVTDLLARTAQMILGERAMMYS